MRPIAPSSRYAAVMARSLGQMIARAREAEAVLEAVLREFGVPKAGGYISTGNSPALARAAHWLAAGSHRQITQGLGPDGPVVILLPNGGRSARP